ncbi:FAD binding domain-containing protein [Marinibaculum pumilum]|uniref:FAD binding domain-containing protein n=1 Tax=Marinibaculum pumilum TaxID=1766165 RepID=A0ABV7KU20_9PROT
MRPFAYTRAADPAAAIHAAGRGGSPSGYAPAAAIVGHAAAPAQYLGGGTTLLDLMKLDVMRPELLVDINPLADGEAGRIEAGADTLRLGALVSMADAADHPEVARDWPALAQSLALAASPQLRNMARLGGNVLQRTRCPYFRSTDWPCNKRSPGSGCAAMEGQNRLHAVLGTSDHCIASYPGDFANALLALDAQVELLGPEGARTMPVQQLHRQPGERPQVETVLARGEMITAFTVPRRPWFRRSLYLKVRDRESYAFALASAAVALDMADGQVARSGIALGGVATLPWRAAAAEKALLGRRLTAKVAEEAAEAEFAEAVAHEHNAFKLDLGRQVLARAILQAADLEL